MPLFYSGASSSTSERIRPEIGEYLHTAAVCHLDAVVERPSSEPINFDMHLEAALCGDAIVNHCLATGFSVVPDYSEPNTTRQAYAFPDCDRWRDSVYVELDFDSYRSRSVYTASRIAMDHHVGLCKPV